ncbi:MAG: choice-of-anchor Q domain-containing protein [Ignavibacteriaceae bacterium]
MSKNLYFLFVLISIPIFITTSLPQTSIQSGEVYGTWDYTGSPYQVKGNITIPNDSILIIKPGVLVEFWGYYALNVQGQLLAVGNEENKIIFTVNDTTGFQNSDTTLGGWNGIQFINTNIENDTSKLIFCSFQYGKAVGSSPPDNSGGAIYILNFDKVLISNCLISNNSAGGLNSPSGGGLCLQFSNIILENNEISHNHAWDGGGIQIWESDPVFINNKIIFNTAEAGGGGIWIGGMSNSEFNGDTISNNTAGSSGGGMICWQTTNTTLNSVSFKNNAAKWGGGVGVIECELEVDSCIFINNGSFELGGGLGSNSSTVSINNTNFEKDTAAVYGGAIEIYNSELFINNCSLKENMTGILGGGIHADFSKIIIDNTIFESDSADNSGGAIFTWQSELEINNSEFNNNTAKYSGGGVYSDSTIMTVNNSGFAQNTTADNGGAIFLNLSTATINNSLFTQNSAIWGGGILSGQSGLYSRDCSFKQNSSEHGGAINFGFGNAEFNNVSFVKNNGIWGGGISAANCDLYVDSCLFSQNTVTNEAGAIEYFADSTIFDRSYKFSLRETGFIENSAVTRSGAVRIEQTQSDYSLVDLVLDSCQFTGNHSYAHGSLRIAGNIENFVISNCLFNGNTAERNTGGPGFAANTKGEVFNCVFNSNYYLFTDSTKNAHGVSLQTEAEVDFYNCTIVDTSSANGYGLSARRGAKANLTNCILWGCGDRPIILTTVADLGCKVNVNYCDIENGIDSLKVSDSSSVINWGDGNITEDPLFVDLDNADLHLRDSSPCIGAGINSKEINGSWFFCPSTDLDGNTRPNPKGSFPDLGAYESTLPLAVGIGNKYL